MPIVVAGPEAALHPAATELARGGFAVRPVARWEDLVATLAAPETRLALVDPALPGLDPALLDALARSLPHRPRVTALGAHLPPLARVPATERAIRRLAAQVEGPAALGAADRRELTVVGLGPDAIARVVALARSPLPVLLHGERGTGKEVVARALHRVAAAGGPMVVVAPGTRWERDRGPGLLYFDAAHRRDPVELRHAVKDARALGWTVAAGTRDEEPPPGVEWARVRLPPLRERANELPGLFQGMLDRHAARLGLGRRVPDRALLTRMHGWRWPENLRELEMFTLHLLTAMPGPRLRGDELPETVARLLQPRGHQAEGEVAGFEELAGERLRPVVASYVAHAGAGLHPLVMDAAERALLRLVLERTGGNRKAAAELLGVARNTLLARIRALGVSASRESPPEDPAPSRSPR